MSRLRSNLKKTYYLQINGKNRDRLLDAAKHDIRKYAKRERGKSLSEGIDFWDFDCKVGASAETAALAHFSEIMGAVDALVKDGAVQFYVEIFSKPGYRAPRSVNLIDVENAP